VRGLRPDKMDLLSLAAVGCRILILRIPRNMALMARRLVEEGEQMSPILPHKRMSNCLGLLLCGLGASLLLMGCQESASYPLKGVAAPIVGTVGGFAGQASPTENRPSDEQSIILAPVQAASSGQSVQRDVSLASFITLTQLADLESRSEESPQDDERSTAVWEFPSTPSTLGYSTTPQPLPDVEEHLDASTPSVVSTQLASDRSMPGPMLMAPQQVEATASLPGETPTSGRSDMDEPARPLTKLDLRVADDPNATGRSGGGMETAAADNDHALVSDELSEEGLALLAQSTAAATGAPSGDRVNEQAMRKLRSSNELAARGAYYAARAELIEVLEMIAEAKDAIHGSVRRSRALADGMRALDEAEDFVEIARGTGGGDRVATVATAHETELGKRGMVDGFTPWQAADVYLRFAQLNLGAAVAGEPAGSMALHALGKLDSRMASAADDGGALASRRAFACQQASLLARNDNYLAAHELGVLLAESGHYQDAETVLRQVALQRPDPIVFRNLAHVNRMLGQASTATQIERQAVALASNRQSPMGVQLVPPATFVGAGEGAPLPAAVASRSMAPAASPARRMAPPMASPPTATAAKPWYLK